ncbi:MAG: hypothetical protein WC011_01445 [Candidatus Paceibacterota bacterium]
MKNNNMIRFVQSLVLLPFVTTVPVGNIAKTNTIETPLTISIQKLNTNPFGLIAFNQAEIKEDVIDQEEVILAQKAKAIDDYFEERDMPLAGYGRKMVVEAEKNDLDWRLLAAISVRESTGGKFACKKVKFSAFGWGSCKINFDSYDHSIEVVARNLGGNNPKTERYYGDKTTYQILRTYNPAHIVLKYPEQVIKIMNDIGPEDFEKKELALNS